MRYLNRRTIYILSVALALFFAGYTLPTVENVRDRITDEYFKHKGFLFDLQRASLSFRRSAGEKEVGELLEDMGLRAESIYRSGSGVEVRMRNVHWRRIPDLIFRLERSFRLESFSAVDNTGKGIFEVRIVLR